MQANSSWQSNKTVIYPNNRHMLNLLYNQDPVQQELSITIIHRNKPAVSNNEKV